MLFKKNKDYEILFITNLPSFYKVNLFNELSKKTHIKVLFISDKSLIRNEDFYGKELLFDYEIVTNVPYENRNSLLVAFRLFKAVFTTRYKKIIYSGWESKELIFFPFITAKSKNGIVIESSILETKATGIHWVLKKFIINRMSYAFPSGSLQNKILDKAGFKGEVFITHGVGISNFQKRNVVVMKDNMAKNENLKFLYVGRLSREKNLSILIEAFSQTQHKLIIAGSGEEFTHLKNKATNNVTFLGYVDNTSLVEIYAGCDCFVLPSLSEPWGLVVEEALSMGLPVILSDKVGCHEDMVNAHNGIIFDATNSNSLLLAISNMAENIDSFKAAAATYDPLENQQKQLSAYLRSLK